MRILILLIAAVVAGFLVIILRPRSAKAELLKEGDLAPDFSTGAVVGNQQVPVKLTDYRGHKVVLYFYPKDNTPGCTKEACAFRDGFRELKDWGIVVLGCSIDSADKHKAFAQKYKLPFPLLIDSDNKIAKAYGADNGIPILGLDRRVTYVIDEDGRILKVYPEVNPGTHANEIIQALGADKPPPSPTPAPHSAATMTPVAIETPSSSSRTHHHKKTSAPSNESGEEQPE
ncbi:MAG TPA: peroxiredoxin [Candidatus Binataceae bacterium]|nr:peroxiredoxin [Candidatus Binataceae bacterium]